MENKVLKSLISKEMNCFRIYDYIQRNQLSIDEIEYIINSEYGKFEILLSTIIKYQSVITEEYLINNIDKFSVCYCSIIRSKKFSFRIKKIFLDMNTDDYFFMIQ